MSLSNVTPTPVQVNPAEKKKPASQRKIQANRQNALKSSGPKTLSGKAHSRRNSFKHGFFAKHLSSDFVFSREDQGEFHKLRARLRAFDPVGPLEELEIERVEQCWWRLARAWRYENAEIRAGITDVALVEMLRSAEQEMQTRGQISPELMNKMVATIPSFKRLWREAERHAEETERSAEQARELRLALGIDSATDTSEDNPESSPDVSEVRKVRLAHQTVKNILQSLNLPTLHSIMRVEYERNAIPNDDAMNKILRYEEATEKNLSRALDRLERLQRRRKGEPVPPPVSVRLTR